jgi:tetratricopeptide (TPR) repeat protein
MATDDIPLGMRLNVMRTLSQLHMVSEDYDNALKYVDMLIENSLEPSADNHILKAQILYQMERMDPAMAEIETGIELQAAKGLPPRENWLLLKNAIFYHRNDYRGMLAVVKQLVDLYPRDRYLLNMAAIYGELGDSKKQLALMEPLYERGSLSNVTHVVNLASLYLLHDIPIKAARLLDQEIETKQLKGTQRNLDMLAQAWLLAGHPDRAVGPMQTAARLSEDGRGYMNLARTYMSLLNWEAAEESVRQALKKGGLRDEGNARLLMGMAQFNQKHFRDARRSFAQAGQAPKTEKLARQWLAYLEREEANAELAREVGME